MKKIQDFRRAIKFIPDGGKTDAGVAWGNATETSKGGEGLSLFSVSSVRHQRQQIFD